MIYAINSLNALKYYHLVSYQSFKIHTKFSSFIFSIKLKIMRFHLSRWQNFTDDSCVCFCRQNTQIWQVILEYSTKLSSDRPPRWFRRLHHHDERARLHRHIPGGSGWGAACLLQEPRRRDLGRAVREGDRGRPPQGKHSHMTSALKLERDYIIWMMH